jgi:hypothetical protein
VKAPAVQTFLVREIVERVGDEIDGHDVDAPALDADRRHPRWQHVAHLLQQFEKVVRAVDLVDVAGFRVADDETRPVDPPRPLAVGAHDTFGQMLGAEIRVIQVFGFLEHVFAEDAVVEPRRGNRADVMEAAGLHALGKFDCMSRAVDVGGLLGFGAGREIVDRGQMEQVPDLALELLELGVGHAEVRLGQIADHGDHSLVVGAPGFAEAGELLLRVLAHEDIDRVAVLEQVLDKKTADKAGPAGHEVSHCDSSSQNFGLAPYRSLGCDRGAVPPGAARRGWTRSLYRRQRRVRAGGAAGHLAV